jgi:hypothetical protein
MESSFVKLQRWLSRQTVPSSAVSKPGRIEKTHFLLSTRYDFDTNKDDKAVLVLLNLR